MTTVGAVGAPTVVATHAFRAMNTEWWVTATNAIDRAEVINLAEVEALVRQVERRLSRFLDDSALSRLNRERAVEDEWVAEVVARSLDMTRLTDGAFDVRVASALAAAGYDRSFELLAAHPVSRMLSHIPSQRSARPLSIEVAGTTVRLDGDGAIDLGGIAKGWTVDLVGELLTRRGADGWLVDGGGDIRARGAAADGTPWLVGIGDGLAVRLDEAAVCTSSVHHRRWSVAGGEAHHIIDPTRGRPASGEITTAVVVAMDTTTADALATAMIADPARGMRALEAAGAAALMERDGHWEMTESMGAWLV